MAVTHVDEARAVAPVRSGLPAPLTKMATAVTLGAALQIGLGIAGKLLAAQAAAPKARPKRSRALRPAEGAVEGDAGIVSETLVYRRLWVRRG